MREAGVIDGATRWQILRKLIVPHALPGMIAVFMVVMLTTLLLLPWILDHLTTFTHGIFARLVEVGRI